MATATLKAPVEIQMNGIYVVECQYISNSEFKDEEWWTSSVYPKKERAELSCKLHETYNPHCKSQTRTRMKKVPFNLEFDGKYTPYKPKKGGEKFWVIKTQDSVDPYEQDIYGVYSSEEKARIGLANIILNNNWPERTYTGHFSFQIEMVSIDQC